MNRHFLIFPFLLSTSLILAQSESADELKRIKLREIYVSSGLLTEPQLTGTLADFQQLAPESQLLQQDFSTFETWNFSGLSSQSFVSIVAGFRFSNKDRSAWLKSPALRVGLSYSSRTNSQLYYSRKEYFPYDTLTSSQSGQIYYIDSVNQEYYNMDFVSNQLKLDASLIYRTNEQERWTLFGGFGTSIGISLSDYTSISHTLYKGTASTLYAGNSGSQHLNFEHAESEYERFENKGSFNFSVYIPMGFDFRIGKKSVFWRQVHLYYELRPGIVFNSVDVLGTHFNQGVQQGFGIRIKWNETIERLR